MTPARITEVFNEDQEISTDFYLFLNTTFNIHIKVFGYVIFYKVDGRTSLIPKGHECVLTLNILPLGLVVYFTDV